MSFVIDKTVTDKAPKKTVVSQFTGNNSSLVREMRIVVALVLTVARRRF